MTGKTFATSLFFILGVSFIVSKMIMLNLFWTWEEMIWAFGIFAGGGVSVLFLVSSILHIKKTYRKEIQK